MAVPQIIYRINAAITVLIVGALLLAGCDIPGPDAPATATDIPITILAASPTVLPIVPTVVNQDTSNVGVDGFTPVAGVLSSSDANATITPTPAPTEVVIPLSYIADDGVVLAASFYGAPARPAPTVLLLHMNGGNKESWRVFAAQLQVSGYNVLALDLRGHGDSGGIVDYTKAPDDVIMVLKQLPDVPGVDPARISVVGASIGANLGLVACAAVGSCKSLVMISPALNYGGVETGKAIITYGGKPLFIAASRDEKPSGTDSQALDKLATGDHTLKLYDGTVHGLALFNTQPDLHRDIIEWLGTR